MPIKRPALPLTLAAFAAALTVTAQAQTLVVLNKQENTLVAIDATTMKIIGRVPTGNGPHEAAVSPDGKLAVVANYGAQQPGNSLSIIDLSTLKETKRVDLGALLRPHGMQQVGGKFYITSETSRNVLRYDPVADRVDWLMGTGASVSHMLVVAPDGKKVYTANIGSNNVTALNIGGPSNAAAIAQIAVGPQPEAIDISPDGKELWVGHNGDGRISIIDTASDTLKETIKAGELPIRVKFTVDGKRVLVSDPKSNEVIVIDAATRRDVKRIKLDGVPLGILLHPAGKLAYISRAQAGEVTIIDLEKLEAGASVKTGDGPDGLAWSTLAPTSK
jgi:YVTN family beta-propeller protein